MVGDVLSWLSPEDPHGFQQNLDALYKALALVLAALHLLELGMDGLGHREDPLHDVHAGSKGLGHGGWQWLVQGSLRRCSEMRFFHAFHPREQPDMAHILPQPLTSPNPLLSLLCLPLQLPVQTGAGTHRDIGNNGSGTSSSAVATDVLA